MNGLPSLPSLPRLGGLREPRTYKMRKLSIHRMMTQKLVKFMNTGAFQKMPKNPRMGVTGFKPL